MPVVSFFLQRIEADLCSVTMDKADVPKIIGEPSDCTPECEADNFMTCPGCRALIDCRDLGTVIVHAGELPHGQRKVAMV
jgi:hypothetical protein